MKRWLTLLLVLTILFALPGCSMIEGELSNLLPFDIPDDYLDLTPDWGDNSNDNSDDDWDVTWDETEAPAYEEATEPLPAETEIAATEPALSLEELYAGILGDFAKSDYYCLYDLDGDNQPELCILEQNETICSIYGIKNQVVYCFGSFPLGNGGFVSGVYGDRGLLICNRPNGTYRELTYVTLEGSRLYSEVLYSGCAESFDYLTPLSIYSAREEAGLQWQGNPKNDHHQTLNRCRTNLLFRYSQEQHRLLNIFLSNFSEVGWETYPASDAQILEFAYLRLSLNWPDTIKKTEDGVSVIKYSDVSWLLERYLGINPPTGSSIYTNRNGVVVAEYDYEEDIYLFYGWLDSVRDYVTVAESITRNSNGTYTVTFSAYTCSVSPSRTQYLYTAAEAATASELTYAYSGTAVVRDYRRSDGVDTYQLLEYDAPATQAIYMIYIY